MYNSVVSAIPPGGINFKVSNINVGGPVINGTDQGQCLTGDANIQSFDLSIPFAREDLKGFQSMHVYGRKMRYPQLGTISLSLLTSAFKGGRLSEIFCQDKFYQIELEFNNQCNFSCNNAPKNSLMKIIITNAKLGGYSMNKSIGSISTIDCNFSFGISMSQGVYIFGSKPETRMNSFVRNAEGKYEPNFHGFNKCTPAGSDAPSGLGINKILEQEDSPSSLSIHDYQGAKVLEGSDAPSNITISRYLEQSDAPNNIEISEQ